MRPARHWLKLALRAAVPQSTLILCLTVRWAWSSDLPSILVPILLAMHFAGGSSEDGSRHRAYRSTQRLVCVFSRSARSRLGLSP